MSRELLKFFQGAVTGLLIKSVGDAAFPVSILDIDVPTDEAGNYEDHFVATTVSGRRIKVSFELLEEAQ